MNKLHGARRTAPLLLSCALLALPRVASAQSFSSNPADYALSSNGPLELGNSATTEILIPNPDPKLLPTFLPAPVASNTSVQLAERSHTGNVIAKKLVKSKFQATVHGDVTVTDGNVKFARNTTIAKTGPTSGGNLNTYSSVTLGLSNLVEGDVASVNGGVKLTRMAGVLGNIFSFGEFKGDRDISIGQPGKTLQVKGPASFRDRSEYFSSVIHEGSFRTFGSPPPTFHGGVTKVAPGTLSTPPKVNWTLANAALPLQINPAAAPLTVKSGQNLQLAPGAYGALRMEQDATLQFSPGTYTFASILTFGNAKFVMNLTAPNSIQILVKGDAKIGRRFAMEIPAANDIERLNKAAYISYKTLGIFRLDSDSLWFGNISTKKSLLLGKNVTLTGSAWSEADLSLGYIGKVYWVKPAL